MKSLPLQTPIKVWYKSLPGSSKNLWPILDIKLSHQESYSAQRLSALVDSGSNMSILHPFVAEALGYNLKRLGAPKLGGTSASGNYESWILPESIQVNISGYTFNFNFIVINNPQLPWGCILGEDSIFQVARLDFSKFRGYFEIRFRSDIN